MEKAVKSELTQSVNSVVKYCNTDDISDGYHTFGELYEHRITLFIAMCKFVSDFQDYLRDDGAYGVWRSKKHSDGELAFGGDWFVLGIGKDAGKQITYHLPISKWEECIFAVELITAPTWDGHSSSDVLLRIKNL